MAEVDDREFAAKVRAAMEVGRQRNAKRKREEEALKAAELAAESARQAAGKKKREDLHARIRKILYAEWEKYEPEFLAKIEKGEAKTEMRFDIHPESPDDYQAFTEMANDVTKTRPRIHYTHPNNVLYRERVTIDENVAVLFEVQKELGPFLSCVVRVVNQ